MKQYFLLFLVSAGLSLALTPFIRSFAQWAKILDYPSERKIHKKPIPLLGGMPIFFSFNLTVIVAVLLNPSYLNESVLSKWKTLLICQILILGLGVLDDILKLQPSIKFFCQIIIGLLIALFGFGIKEATNPFSGETINFGIFAVPITIVWLVGITNALNLIDGLDGLAVGTGLITSLTIFALAFFNLNMGVTLVAIILAGSLLGFLRYNFFPAKIFLGDSGSLYIGFLLAVFSIQGASKGATLIAMLAPILALGLPIMDTLIAMIRRLLRSVHIIDYPTRNGNFKAFFFRWASMFRGDKDHVHHRLLKLGFSQRKAVVVLYAICISLSVLAFISAAFKDLNIIAFLGAIVIAFFIGIKSLKYEEFKILESGLLFPIFSFPVINRRIFQAFFDLGLIAFSAYLSFFLVFNGFGNDARTAFIQSLPILLLVKVIIFFLLGLYKKTWTYFSLEEVLGILGAVFLASLGSLFISLLIRRIEFFGGIVFFVLDFYLLLTLAGGVRVANRILSSYHKKSFFEKKKNILIYGAGYRGSTVVKELRHNGNHSLSPVGFIDDDPAKKGKTLHDCPILGSIEDLEEISGDINVSEIIVSSGKIAKDRIKRLVEFGKKNGIIIRQFEFRFYEFP